MRKNAITCRCAIYLCIALCHSIVNGFLWLAIVFCRFCKVIKKRANSISKCVHVARKQFLFFQPVRFHPAYLQCKSARVQCLYYKRNSMRFLMCEWPKDDINRLRAENIFVILPDQKIVAYRKMIDILQIALKFWSKAKVAFDGLTNNKRKKNTERTGLRMFLITRNRICLQSLVMTQTAAKSFRYSKNSFYWIETYT